LPVHDTRPIIIIALSWDNRKLVWETGKPLQKYQKYSTHVSAFLPKFPLIGVKLNFNLANFCTMLI